MARSFLSFFRRSDVALAPATELRPVSADLNAQVATLTAECAELRRENLILHEITSCQAVRIAEFADCIEEMKARMEPLLAEVAVARTVACAANAKATAAEAAVRIATDRRDTVGHEHRLDIHAELLEDFRHQLDEHKQLINDLTRNDAAIRRSIMGLEQVVEVQGDTIESLLGRFERQEANTLSPGEWKWFVEGTRSLKDRVEQVEVDVAYATARIAACEKDACEPLGAYSTAEETDPLIDLGGESGNDG